VDQIVSRGWMGRPIVSIAVTVMAVIVLLVTATPAGTVAARTQGGQLVATATSPSPAPAAVVSTKRTVCAGYTLTATSRDDAWDENPPAEPDPSLTVTGPDGTAIASWTGSWIFEQGDFQWCIDIDADGTPELAYSTYSGGAHCCFTFVVLHLGAAPREMLAIDLLDTGSLTPRQLDKTPALELVALDLRLRYMGGSFASTSPFPRVFALRDGVYVDAPRSYASFMLADRAKAVREIARCGPVDYDGECRRSIGLRIEAIDLLLGRPTSGISRLPVDLATRKWILSMRKDVATAVGSGPGPLHPQVVQTGLWDMRVGGTDVIGAGSTSGLPVKVMTLTPDVCSGVTAGDGRSVRLSYIKVGTCTVRAEQAGNAYWKPASTTASDAVTEPEATSSPVTTR
jgi:hypothetical protein